MIIGTLHIGTIRHQRNVDWYLDTVKMTDRLREEVEGNKEEIEFKLRKIEQGDFHIVVEGNVLKVKDADISIVLSEEVGEFVNADELKVFLGGLVSIKNGFFRASLKSRIGFQSEIAQWQEQLRQMVQGLSS